MSTEHNIFDYARMAAQAEQRILDLLDKSLHDDLVDARLEMDLQESARSRQGSESSGQLN